MQRYIIILSLATCIWLAACREQVNVVQLYKGGNPEDTTALIFFNDSISVCYNFWNGNTDIRFTIKNNLKKTVFIDWTKSFYRIHYFSHGYWENATEASKDSISAIHQDTRVQFSRILPNGKKKCPGKIEIIKPGDSTTMILIGRGSEMQIVL